MRGDGREVFELFWDPRHLRNRWLTELSQTMDDLLRSPAFLESMRFGFKALTEAQALQTRGFFDLCFKWSRLLPTPTAAQRALPDPTPPAEPNRGF